MGDQVRPAAGIDYPRTYQEFVEWFGDDAACRRYLVRCRWPDGFRCAGCGKTSAPWTTGRGYLHCRDCGAEISVLSGTIFERTRISLRSWFAAIWLVTSQKDGASALGLKRVLGLGSYQTAWSWLHKLRRAMVRPDREQLQGRIEVDETYVGGSEVGSKRGRGSARKEIVVIALEVLLPKGYGRVRMSRIPDTSSTSLVPFVRDVVAKDSEILTDGWTGYKPLSQHGYRHTPIPIRSTGEPAHVAMPGVHRIAALLKRWLMSTHQGAVSGKHLDYYLDEYTFRFNRRTSGSRGLLFYRLIQQAVQTAPSPYHVLVGPKHNG